MQCLFFKASTIKVARVIEKVIVDDRSHVDYDGFVHHSCYHFGALGDVTVILLFFGPTLSTVRGVARVIAKVIWAVALALTMMALFTTAAVISAPWGK